MRAMAEACDFLRATRDSLCRQQGFSACDGVRAIAVLWVCAGHAFPLNDRFHLVGFWKLLVPATSSIAVDLFFVLSGFLIGSALQREAQKGLGQMAWATFYLRRLFRIVPAYLSAALVTLAITRSTQDEHDGCPSLWRNVLFINNFFPLNANCLQQSWSIAVEMQLYFFTPPIFLLAEKLASCTPRLSSASWVFVLCVIAWVACCALRLQRVLAVGQEQDYGAFDVDFYFFTQYKFGPYAAGVAAGVAVTMSTVSSEEGAACGAASLKTLAMIGSYAAVGLAWLNGGDFTDDVVQNPAALPWLFVLASSFLRPLLGAAVAHLLALCVTGQAPRLNGFLSARLWGPIAGLSYSMYLFQQVGRIFFYEPFMDATASAELPNASHLVNLLRAYAAIILFILGALPLALVSYALAERPGILLGKKVISAMPLCRKSLAASGSAAQSAKDSRSTEKQEQLDELDLEANLDMTTCAASSPQVSLEFSSGCECSLESTCSGSADLEIFSKNATKPKLQKAGQTRSFMALPAEHSNVLPRSSSWP